ncbi:amidohydrolase family protein [Pseudomonas citronellolis]|jgi:predicted TIM-barrel fold metal-dependent hydrolase|uniref:amidohydrolase family protein n=1 Tax=Pseudomonas citronellolis TaxID=53408 RepID=UPI00226FD95B|nr:amidohydrolase family protein [Pseudomonas citronellolis]WAB90667.1 amidohydrolase family protein [Pseudomonas citronellolis]
MKIIDMRCRPAFLHPFFGAEPGSAEHATARWLNRRVGTRGDDAHFERSLTQEGFLAEVRDAGLHKAVVVGRHTPAQHLPNERIHAIVDGHAQLLGIGSVDPALQGVEGALAEIDHAIDDLGLAGIDLEPGFGEPARHPDDALYWPIYEHLQKRATPLFLMSGPTTPDPAYNDPGRLAAVARAFPDLRIVAYHSFWPNVQQAIGLAFRYENIHLVPDMYLFLPGSEAYVQAANGFLADQLLFGSSYTFRPIRQSIEDAQRLGLSEHALERFFHGNAARLFGLD